jgi:pyruvate dehydrogenase E2 component (dihydrolipoamide acetyltransferase)
VAAREIKIPDIGAFKDVEVIDLLVKAGDSVAVDTPILTLETDKATMDVPTPVAGVIERVLVQKGSRVSAGTPMMSITVSEAAQPAKAATAAAPAAAPSTAKPAAAAAGAVSPVPAAVPALPVATLPLAGAINETGFAAAHASPSVRAFARQLGVDLTRVSGTGQKARITQDDVKAWVKAALASGAGGAAGAGLPRVPVVDFAQFGAIEVKPLSRIKRISGARLHASWVNLPHVTQFDEADITALEAERVRLKDSAAKQGVKLTPLAFVLRAVVRTLQAMPQFNASLDASGENLVYKKYIHLGFAADTPNGLMVPVIRDADKKDVYELARALGELSAKARTGKLPGTDMQGGSFTVSSLGGIGGTAFTPIINAPEVAILGVSRSSLKPVYQHDGRLLPRLMLPLSLSYDHRVIDGADGARFSSALAAQLADVPGLLEAVP